MRQPWTTQRSAVGGPFAVHPFGNKGADLIEAIRLERVEGRILLPRDGRLEASAKVRESRCRAHPQVKIHTSPESVQMLLRDSDRIQCRPVSAPQCRRQNLVPTGRRDSASDALERLRKEQSLANDRAVRRLRQQQQLRAAIEDRAFQDAVKSIRSEQEHFVPAVTLFLRLRAEDQENKKVTLHQKWEAQRLSTQSRLAEAIF